MNPEWVSVLVAAAVSAGPCLYWLGRLSARVDKTEAYVEAHRVEVAAKSEILLRNDEILCRAVAAQDAMVRQLDGIYERLRGLELANARSERGAA